MWLSKNDTKANPAAQTSSSITYSSGEWLMPPRQRTNSIPTCSKSYFTWYRIWWLYVCFGRKGTLLNTNDAAKEQTLVRWDIAIASCPAPLIKTGTSSTLSPAIFFSALSAADFSWELSPLSLDTALASCWKYPSQDFSKFLVYAYKEEKNQMIIITFRSTSQATDRLSHIL